MSLLKSFVSRAEEAGANYIFESLKILMIPAPLTLLTIIHSLENFIIHNPFMIYIIFIIPALLFGICLYSLIKTKEKNSKLEKQNKELTIYTPRFNVLWDKNANPFSPCCQKYMSHCFYTGHTDKGFPDRDDLICPACDRIYHLLDEKNQKIGFNQAKSIVINGDANVPK